MCTYGAHMSLEQPSGGGGRGGGRGGDVVVPLGGDVARGYVRWADEEAFGSLVQVKMIETNAEMRELQCGRAQEEMRRVTPVGAKVTEGRCDDKTLRRAVGLLPPGGVVGVGQRELAPPVTAESAPCAAAATAADFVPCADATAASAHSHTQQELLPELPSFELKSHSSAGGAEAKPSDAARRDAARRDAARRDAAKRTWHWSEKNQQYHTGGVWADSRGNWQMEVSESLVSVLSTELERLRQLDAYRPPTKRLRVSNMTPMPPSQPSSGAAAVPVLRGTAAAYGASSMPEAAASQMLHHGAASQMSSPPPSLPPPSLPPPSLPPPSLPPRTHFRGRQRCRFIMWYNGQIISNRCRYGAECRFSHDRDSPLQKTWICPNPSCEYSNLARRTECRQCGANLC